MKQEDKELLLKDLCTRLPYGVKISVYNHWRDEPQDELISIENLHQLIETFYIGNIKPYLFPLSSMTEEQRREYDKIIYHSIELHHREYSDIVEIDLFEDLQEFYHKNHFDYRGLIEKGLAIDATGLNIY